MTKKISFEEGIRKIEEIISLLENKVSLEESVKYYEEAMKLVKKCHDQLEEVKGRVQKVTEKGLEDFEID